MSINYGSNIYEGRNGIITYGGESVSPIESFTINSAIKITEQQEASAIGILCQSGIKAGIAGLGLQQMFTGIHNANKPVILEEGGDNMGIIPPPPPPIRYNKGGEIMSMTLRQAMDHTRMRFETMTKTQMWTRMGKTTDSTKLEAFAIVARELEHHDIAAAASTKLAMARGLTVTAFTTPVASTTNRERSELNKAKSNQQLRRIDI